MGPYLNVSPPGLTTSLHQNGQGTLDSGIVCISGFLEVVILRRLTERHKQNAIAILYGSEGGHVPSLYETVSSMRWEVPPDLHGSLLALCFQKLGRMPRILLVENVNIRLTSHLGSVVSSYSLLQSAMKIISRLSLVQLLVVTWVRENFLVGYFVKASERIVEEDILIVYFFMFLSCFF